MKCWKIITREQALTFENDPHYMRYVACSEYYIYLNAPRPLHKTWRGDVLVWQDGSPASDDPPLGPDDELISDFAVEDSPWFKRCAEAVQFYQEIRITAEKMREVVRMLPGEKA